MNETDQHSVLNVSTWMANIERGARSKQRGMPFVFPCLLLSCANASTGKTFTENPMNGESYNERKRTERVMSEEEKIKTVILIISLVVLGFTLWLTS